MRFISKIWENQMLDSYLGLQLQKKKKIKFLLCYVVTVTPRAEV